VPLGEAAYRRLRADIASCRLAPGQRLTERGLAARTGFGVASVREALTRLDHEGLVITAPRKGYRVKPLTIKAVNDLFQFWMVIGPELVRLGIAGATDAELKQAAAGFRELSRVVTEDGPTRELALRSVEIADRTFRVLGEATRNEYFISAITRVEGEMSRVWTLVTDSELLQHGEVSAHLDQWHDTLILRDGDTAAGLAREHIEQYHDRILRTLAVWPSVITSEVTPVREAAEDRHPQATLAPRNDRAAPA
jgi:DNA-binding GntR family transcriptional regulator